MIDDRIQSALSYIPADCREKTCSNCGTSKQVLEFTKKASSKDGLDGRCRLCLKEINAAYRQQNPEKGLSASRSWKERNPQRIQEKRAAYVAGNAERISRVSKEWRDRNPDKVKTYRERAQSASGKAVAAAWARNNSVKKASQRRAWHLANREKTRASSKAWVAANPEKASAGRKRWREANQGQRRIHQINRESRKRNGGELSQGLAPRLFALQRGLCPCCKRPLGDDFHLDHKMPLALGGSNTDDNMQLLRAECNLQKHAKHPVDFMQSRGVLL